MAKFAAICLIVVLAGAGTITASPISDFLSKLFGHGLSSVRQSADSASGDSNGEHSGYVVLGHEPTDEEPKQSPVDEQKPASPEAKPNDEAVAKAAELTKQVKAIEEVAQKLQQDAKSVEAQAQTVEAKAKEVEGQAQKLEKEVEEIRKKAAGSPPAKSAAAENSNQPQSSAANSKDAGDKVEQCVEEPIKVVAEGNEAPVDAKPEAEATEAEDKPRPSIGAALFGGFFQRLREALQKRAAARQAQQPEAQAKSTPSDATEASDAKAAPAFPHFFLRLRRVPLFQQQDQETGNNE